MMAFEESSNPQKQNELVKENLYADLADTREHANSFAIAPVPIIPHFKSDMFYKLLISHKIAYSRTFPSPSSMGSGAR